MTRIKYAWANPFINISINELTQEVTQFRSGEINNTLPLQRFKPFNGKISGSHEDIDSSRWVKGPMPFSGNDPRNCFTQSAIMRLKISGSFGISLPFDVIRILYIVHCRPRLIAPIAQLSTPLCPVIKFNRTHPRQGVGCANVSTNKLFSSVWRNASERRSME